MMMDDGMMDDMASMYKYSELRTLNLDKGRAMRKQKICRRRRYPVGVPGTTVPRSSVAPTPRASAYSYMDA